MCIEKYITADNLERSWREILAPEFSECYMENLVEFLRAKERAGKAIYPSPGSIFSAFAQTPLPKVRVVIVGQDPYPGENVADGLCFSTQQKIICRTGLPDSLRNIYDEIECDFQESGLSMPKNSGDLSPWAKQGVLLLNSFLTVSSGSGEKSHTGWKSFTDRVVEVVSEKHDHVVFMLWGIEAKKKADIIDKCRHRVLCASHPSPLSAHRGFFGRRHFSTANDYLRKHSQEHDQACINWDMSADNMEQ